MSYHSGIDDADNEAEKRSNYIKNKPKDNPFYKKLMEKHQSNEYLHVSKDKEAVCYGCFSKSACTATIVDICDRCSAKKGNEALLTRISRKIYGYCYFCGNYQFNLWQINCRLCIRKCNVEIRRHLKDYNMSGGMEFVDPFWKSMRKKFGEDWRQIFTDGTGGSPRR